VLPGASIHIFDLTFKGSKFNSASLLRNEGMLTLTNSTVSGNWASSGSGGGIFNRSGKANITFSTIYSNKTTDNGGGLSIEDRQDYDGKNIPSKVSISNSIIAGNRAHIGPNISGTLTSDGYNLVQDPSGVIFTPNQQHSTDIPVNPHTNLGIDPMLRDNGGLATLHTFTHALLPGSPAIDKIPLEACHINDISTDQRGMKRPSENENTCDIGAYEYVDSPT
jgi:hypothetical protein